MRQREVEAREDHPALEWRNIPVSWRRELRPSRQESVCAQCKWVMRRVRGWGLGGVVTGPVLNPSVRLYLDSSDWLFCWPGKSGK
eukprot:7108180-Alexandrium_andersonii.AAC.1